MLRRNILKYKVSDLVGKVIIYIWILENGENKEYEGEIRGFEDGVFKVIEYQIFKYVKYFILIMRSLYCFIYIINVLNLYVWYLIIL